VNPDEVFVLAVIGIITAGIVVVQVAQSRVEVARWKDGWRHQAKAEAALRADLAKMPDEPA
jgi:hypothetical protein